MAKTSQRVRQARAAKYKTREYTRCRRCGRSRAVYRKFGAVPDLPARARAQRLHPRHDEEQLVGDHVDDRPHRRLPHPRAQRHHGRRTTTVEIPSSRLKREMARILQEQGYITATRSRRPTPTARASSSASRSSTPRTAARRSPACKRVSRPGQRALRPPRRASRRSRAAWAPRSCPPRSGVMTGHEARAGGRRRRGRRARLVSCMSPHRQTSPSPCPPASTVDDRARARARQRPAAASSRERDPRDIDGRAGGRRSSLVTRPTDRGEHRALHGLTRSLVANMVEGVTDGYEKTPGDPGRRLPRRAQGQRPRARARLLAPRADQGAGRASSSRCPQPTRVIVKGISKQLVGEIAANIRKQRPPEPYKGKGIRYEGEYVARKVGKRA